MFKKNSFRSPVGMAGVPQVFPWCRMPATDVDETNGYVTVMCGKKPRVALSKLSGDMMRRASSIQRQPR